MKSSGEASPFAGPELDDEPDGLATGTLAAGTELQTLTTRLRAATVAYSKTVLDVIEAGTNTSPGTFSNNPLASGLYLPSRP